MQRARLRCSVRTRLTHLRLPCALLLSQMWMLFMPAWLIWVGSFLISRPASFMALPFSMAAVPAPQNTNGGMVGGQNGGGMGGQNGGGMNGGAYGKSAELGPQRTNDAEMTLQL